MSLWDPQQREWLQAMGHSLLALVGDEPADARALRYDEIDEAGRVRGADAREHAAAPARDPIEVKPPVRARPAAPPPVPQEPTAPAPPTRPRADPAAKLAALEAARRGAARSATGPLGEALLRATGQAPAAAARALRELALDPTALRDDPAAKRALWARLRSLRKAASR